MTYLERAIIVFLLAVVAGCATEAGDVKLSTNSTSEPSTAMSASRENVLERQVWDLRLKLGDAQNRVAVQKQTIADLTELLVEAELARAAYEVAALAGK